MRAHDSRGGRRRARGATRSATSRGPLRAVPAWLPRFDRGEGSWAGYLVPWLYLAAIGLAELLVATGNPLLGVIAHTLSLFALLWHGAMATGDSERALLWATALTPLIRVLSLGLPLAGIPVLYWYAVVTVPLVAGTVAASRAIGYTRRDLGLTVRIRHLPLHLLMIPAGLAIGIGQYLLLRPAPVINNLSVEPVWLAVLIIALSAGLGEELFFRGLLLRAANGHLGRGGPLYATALFAGLQFGYWSVPNLALVFVVGFLFALLVTRTGSIVGAVLGHAALAASLLVLAPLLL